MVVAKNPMMQSGKISFRADRGRRLLTGPSCAQAANNRTIWSVFSFQIPRLPRYQSEGREGLPNTLLGIEDGQSPL